MGQGCCAQEDATEAKKADDVSSAVTSLPTLDLSQVRVGRSPAGSAQGVPGATRTRELHGGQEPSGLAGGQSGKKEHGSASAQSSTAAPKVREFTVTLDKTQSNGNTALGIDVELTENEALIVDKVTGGMVGAWNQAHPDEKMEVGDRIVAVNGQVEDANAMTDLAKAADIVELLVQRHIK